MIKIKGLEISKKLHKDLKLVRHLELFLISVELHLQKCSMSLVNTGSFLQRHHSKQESNPGSFI